MVMRISVLLLFGLIYLKCAKGLSEEMQELANMLHSTCVEETGASESDIVNARTGIFADNENFKCYIKCLMAQMACIDDDGTIDVDATIAIIPEEYKAKAEPVIRKCDTVKGASACDNAWLTHQCYQRESPEDYFLL